MEEQGVQTLSETLEDGSTMTKAFQLCKDESPGQLNYPQLANFYGFEINASVKSAFISRHGDSAEVKLFLRSVFVGISRRANCYYYQTWQQVNGQYKWLSRHQNIVECLSGSFKTYKDLPTSKPMRLFFKLRNQVTADEDGNWCVHTPDEETAVIASTTNEGQSGFFRRLMFWRN